VYIGRVVRFVSSNALRNNRIDSSVEEIATTGYPNTDKETLSWMIIIGSISQDTASQCSPTVWPDALGT
jgi:hypothetical protein